MVLLRFAPSPTGPLHLGGLRMALYNYLYARKYEGKWILRIEDTDTTRTVPGSVDGIRHALEWAGLEYDYGPDKGGPHAPYFQSERRDLYRSYADKLLDKGHAYRCFCSADELVAIKTRLARSGSNATYDKRCLHLSDEEVRRKVKAGEKSVVRINDSNPPTRPPTKDLVFGSVRDAHLSLATDPVLLKSDLFPTYHLASVVDDYEMGITHVLRGEEWLVSLPLHLDLYAHLGIPPPQFAHVPILLNADRTKMSKRYGDVKVVDYIRRGWEPEAILNWLALAGWGVLPESDTTTTSSPSLSPSSPSNIHTPTQSHARSAPSSTHLMSLPEMISSFELSALTQRSSVLDLGKLEFINKHWVMKIVGSEGGEGGIGEKGEGKEGESNKDRLAKKVHGFVKETFPDSPYTSVENIKKAITLLDGRLTNIQDIPVHAPYLFVDPDLETEEAKGMVGKIERRKISQILSTLSKEISTNSEFSHRILDSLVEAGKEIGLGRGAVMKVVRWAISGMKDGPGIIDIMRVIGVERTSGRVGKALRKVSVSESVEEAEVEEGGRSNS